MRKIFKTIKMLAIAGCCAMGLAACAMDPTLSYNLGKQNYAEQNYHTAFTYLLESAKWRNADAQYAVGYMYYYGIGTQQNLPKAIKWFHSAAEQGQYKAMMALRVAKAQVPDIIFDNGYKYAAPAAKPTRAERLLSHQHVPHHPFAKTKPHKAKHTKAKTKKLAKLAPPKTTLPQPKGK